MAKWSNRLNPGERTGIRQLRVPAVLSRMARWRALQHFARYL